MYFQHAHEIWRDFPDLIPGVLFTGGITKDAEVRTSRYHEIARSRLAASSESAFPEIQAWRRTFAAMGLKPTQYRCASESLLRRFKKEGALPQIHPLIDLCNAISIAFAVPIAVFDLAHVTDGLEVRYATGKETYLTFSGDTEHPQPDEVIFADAADRAHARRWTNRQSGLSAIRDTTSSVLIVAEAMHGSLADMKALTDALAEELTAAWSVTPQPIILSSSQPSVDSG